MMDERCEAALAVWRENPDHEAYGHRASFRAGFAAGREQGRSERDADTERLERTMGGQLIQTIAQIWHDNPDASIRQTLDALNAMFPGERAHGIGDE
jgi:hypothetical protein